MLFEVRIVTLHFRCHFLVVFCLISPVCATCFVALHKHLVSVVDKRLSTFASLALSILAPMLTHSDWKGECVLKLTNFYFFLSWSKFAFFYVIGKSSNLVATVKTAGTCSFSRCLFFKLLKHWAPKWRNLKRHDWQFNFLIRRQCKRYLFVFAFFTLQTSWTLGRKMA